MCCCDTHRDKMQPVHRMSCNDSMRFCSGAALVPVLVFGENDIWHAHHVKEGNIHKLQEAIKRYALVNLLADR